MSDENKTCSKCKKEKPLSDFWKSWDKRYGYSRARAYCKKCGKKYNNWTKYNLTAEDKQKLYHEQKGCCAICGVHETETDVGRLVVDHNHTTGVVRGLPCYKCNTGLGSFRDNSDCVTKALSYLRERGE